MTNTNTLAQTTNTVVLSTKAIEAVGMLRRARELAETVKALETEAKEILNGELPTNAHGLDFHGTVLISRQLAKNTGVDSKKLKTIFPEAYETCYRETEYAKLILAK